ncbi:MAG: hypothetical protein ACYTBX_02485 [Planctomycetota bacterium]
MKIKKKLLQIPEKLMEKTPIWNVCPSWLRAAAGSAPRSGNAETGSRHSAQPGWFSSASKRDPASGQSDHTRDSTELTEVVRVYTCVA